jgi:hypothetical protein
MGGQHLGGGGGEGEGHFKPFVPNVLLTRIPSRRNSKSETENTPLPIRLYQVVNIPYCTRTYLSYIYLGYFVCLCVIVCVCVCVCHNCRTLCYSFSFGNQTDQGDETEGLKREGLKMERYGKGQIGEGGCEETFHCFSQTWETCRFTVPPAVALLNYISSGILWRIFSPLGLFAGFSLYIYCIINFAVYLCASAQCLFRFRRFFIKQWSVNYKYAWDIIFFRVPLSSFRVRHSSLGCSVAQKGAT